MTIGGTALGQRDFIKSVVASLGGILYNDMVNANPGKTFKFGEIQGKPLFVIPGNPASATICVEIFFNIFINSIYYGKSLIHKSYIKGYHQQEEGVLQTHPRIYNIRGEQNNLL